MVWKFTEFTRGLDKKLLSSLRGVGEYLLDGMTDFRHKTLFLALSGMLPVTKCVIKIIWSTRVWNKWNGWREWVVQSMSCSKHDVLQGGGGANSFEKIL